MKFILKSPINRSIFCIAMFLSASPLIIQTIDSDRGQVLIEWQTNFTAKEQATLYEEIEIATSLALQKESNNPLLHLQRALVLMKPPSLALGRSDGIPLYNSYR